MTHAQPFLPSLVAHVVTSARAHGDKAPSERELADHFAVSRGQVREALAILEAMRLIERRAKSGITLTLDRAGLDSMALMAQAGLPLDPRQIFEAVEIRKIHEIKAAELAAQRARPENFARLHAVLAESEARLAAGHGLDALDADFHLEIVRATQNETFHRICASFYAASLQRLPVYFRDAGRSARSHEEHRRIVDALEGRDGTLAQALMNAHLGAAQSYWTELLDADAAAAPPAA